MAAWGIDDDLVTRQMQAAQAGKLLQANRQTGQLVVAQVEFAKVSEPAQKILFDLLKGHIAQRQAPNMAKVDVRRQARQAAHFFAVDMQ